MTELSHVQRARLRTHLAIHVFLVLLYFLPGGLIWNRVEPSVFGLPFSVVATAVLLPLAIIANIAMYVRRFWNEDKLVSGELRSGATLQAAEGAAEEETIPDTRDEKGGS